MSKLIETLVDLLGHALKGTKTEEEVARELIDAAFATGVPASLLAQHLTAKAAENAELAADLAEWAKLQGR